MDRSSVRRRRSFSCLSKLSAEFVYYDAGFADLDIDDHGGTESIEEDNNDDGDSDYFINPIKNKRKKRSTQAGTTKCRGLDQFRSLTKQDCGQSRKLTAFRCKLCRRFLLCAFGMKEHENRCISNLSIKRHTGHSNLDHSHDGAMNHHAVFHDRAVGYDDGKEYASARPLRGSESLFPDGGILCGACGQFTYFGGMHDCPFGGPC